MKDKKRLFAAFLLFFGASLTVAADVMYQCIDEDGHRSFSNINLSSKTMKCSPMDLGPAHVPATSSAKPSSGSAARRPTPGNFPRVNAGDQKSRDTDRRRILETELLSEQGNLEQARKELAEQEAVRLGNERNYQKVLDRLQPYQNRVAQHERNIEAIQLELSKLR